MVDTMVAGGSPPELYYEYYPYQEMQQQQQHVCPISHDYGPVTVPMVSTNSSPPIAMPVQVPHGHVVQQIVDESGTLRHVILSPQHPMVPLPPPHYGGGSGGGQGYFPGLAHYGPYSLQSGVIPPPHPQQGHSPPPLSFHKDERSQRQYNKLKRKLEQKHLRETTPPLSPRKEMNGNSRKGVGSSVGTSEDGEESSSLQDEEEDVSMITDILASVKAPEVSEVTSRTALVQWSPPQVENAPTEDLKYEVLLSDRGKEGKYKSIYRGEALSCRIEDLRPGTEYSVCVSARLDQLAGCASEPTLLSTPPCRPDPPPPPKLATRTKNSLTLKWLAATDNGSHMEHYTVEWEVDGGNWEEVTRTKNKTAHVTKLQPATAYSFRVSATNQYGKSDYSTVVKFWTCDSPPPQPGPPRLVNATPNTLSLVWDARTSASGASSDEFTLQVHDPRHGFLPAYRGPEPNFVYTSLTNNTAYKFRLKCENEEGSSIWSEEVVYSTLAGRPGAPQRPQPKGRVHSHSFRLKWEPPHDRGNAPITNYILQILHPGSGDYQTVYTGGGLTWSMERAEPGRTYLARVKCEGPGGASDFSESVTITTEPVCPGQCPRPRLHGKPRSRHIHLKWGYPESDGGSPVTELEVTMQTAGETRTAYRGKDTEVVVGDLQPAVHYAFTVRATNKVGPGPWSEALEVQAGCAAPGRPGPPVLAALSGGVSASWSEPPCHGAPIFSYTLYMATTSPDSSAVFHQVYHGLQSHTEIRPLPPATYCLFKLQATNSVGSSEWSECRGITTLAGPPGAVTSIRGTATGSTRLELTWGPAPEHGEKVTHYTVDPGDGKEITVVEPSATLEGLSAGTTYRVRVRAISNVGAGPPASLRLTTLPLPPPPPSLVLVAPPAHNYLKLRWNQPPSATNFTLTLCQPNNRKVVVYEGPGTSHKVSRLQEQTEYSLTIAASNATGKGPESPPYKFTTVIAPPPPVKGVKVCEVTQRRCRVEWTPIRSQGSDPVDYTVQCARLREQTFRQVYRGSETWCEVNDLEAGADYLIRVAATRLCSPSHVEGPPCPPVQLSTPPLPQDPPPHHHVRHHVNHGGSRKPLTDQQWAGIILCCFTVLAVLFAVLIANLIY